MSSSASPRKATQQATISAFFSSQTPARDQGISFERTGKRGPSPIDLTGEEDEVMLVTSTPAAKRAKVSGGATSSKFFTCAVPSASKQTKLKEEPLPPPPIPSSPSHASQWRFTPSADPRPPSPTSEDRDAEKARRHEAFRAALIGPQDPFKRRTALADAKSVEELRQLEASLEPVPEDEPQTEDDAEPEAEQPPPKKGRTKAKTKPAPVIDEDGDKSDPGFKSLMAGFASGKTKTKGRARAAVRPKKPEATIGPSGHSYTPLELQVLELKKVHAGTVLMVEVGYKYLFYNEDAQASFTAFSDDVKPDLLPNARSPPKSSGLLPFRSAIS